MARTCYCDTIYRKGDSAGVIKLKILKWEDFPELSRIRAKDRWWQKQAGVGGGTWSCCAAGFEAGGKGQGMQMAFWSLERQGNGLFSRAPGGTHLAAPFHTSGLQHGNTTNMCSSLPLNVWQSITSAIEGKTVNNITVNNIAVTALQSPSSRVWAQGQLCQQIFLKSSIRPRGLTRV